MKGLDGRDKERIVSQDPILMGAREVLIHWGIHLSQKQARLKTMVIHFLFIARRAATDTRLVMTYYVKDCHDPATISRPRHRSIKDNKKILYTHHHKLLRKSINTHKETISLIPTYNDLQQHS